MTNESDPTCSGINVNVNGNGEFSQIVRKFESSFIRVPFEQFRRAFRLEMKIAEKDLPGLEALFKKHMSNGSGGEKVPDNVMKGLKDRSRALEEKMKKYRGESLKFRERFMRRVRWVEEQATNGNYRTWYSSRLIRLIGDFLIRSGDMETVREMGEGRPELIADFDLELEEIRNEIRVSLKGKCLNASLQWCADHRNNLKRIGSDFEFKLRRQEFIELLRSDDISGALKASQKHFPAWLETNYKEIREVLALICWLPLIGKKMKMIWSNGLMKKYEELLGLSQWSRLEEQFESDFVSVYQIDKGCQLIKTVRTGLSVLKTRQCSKSGGEGNEGCFNSQCPACSGPLRDLARELPYGHFETTKIRCRITGKLMGADDPPMALPNGQVFSEGGLRHLANGGTSVKCPVTLQTFLFSEARKCFFL